MSRKCQSWCKEEVEIGNEICNCVLSVLSCESVEWVFNPLTRPLHFSWLDGKAYIAERESQPTLVNESLLPLCRLKQHCFIFNPTSVLFCCLKSFLLLLSCWASFVPYGFMATKKRVKPHDNDVNNLNNASLRDKDVKTNKLNAEHEIFLQAFES